MKSVSDQNRPMTDVAHITNSARLAAAELVDREERRLRSRMAAYETVASMVGVSSSWLRRFLARSTEVTLSIPAVLNIRAQYARLVLRLDAEIANERALIAALQDDLNAAANAITGTDPSEAKTATDGTVDQATRVDQGSEQ